VDVDADPGADDDADGDDTVAEASPADVFEREPGVDYGERAHLDAAGAPRIVERRFVVEPELAGLRLDHYLKRQIPRLSRTRIQAIIAAQLHAGDGRPVKPHTAVVAGETYTIRREARAEPPCPRTFGVLHTDADVLVVDKPAGLPVHATAKFYFNTLTRVLAERFPGEPLQICHRLDRETSGALVVARGKAAAATIKGAFAHKRVAKTYLAIVGGEPPWPDAGAGAGDHVIDVPLVLSQPGDPTRLPGVRMLARPGGLPSTTRVAVEARVPGYALVRCSPITGRQHQIRAHLAAAGFPIVGDKLYGPGGDDAFIRFCDQGFSPELRALFEHPRQALHAASVVFPHPGRPEPLRVDAPLAPDLARFLARATGRA
jgi:23S rRNA pseudouridine1911/1915/1917 synthase